MKKIFFTTLSLIFFTANYSFSDCETGYACSIDFLNNQNTHSEIQFLEKLNDYFELHINEDFMLGKITDDFEYKDFFPFSIMLTRETEDL